MESPAKSKTIPCKWKADFRLQSLAIPSQKDRIPKTVGKMSFRRLIKSKTITAPSILKKLHRYRSLMRSKEANSRVSLRNSIKLNKSWCDPSVTMLKCGGSTKSWCKTDSSQVKKSRFSSSWDRRKWFSCNRRWMFWRGKPKTTENVLHPRTVV